MAIERRHEQERMTGWSRRRLLGRSAGAAAIAISGPALFNLLAANAVGAQGEKTLTWARGDDLRTQDPQEISGLMEGTIARLVYDPLIDTDENLELVPALATEWEMAEDGLSYTFTLRDGVVFHDGTPFNADSVKFTFDRLLQNEQLQHAAIWLESLSEVRIDDPLTVTFLLTAPNPGLITSFPAESILAHNAIDQYGENFFERSIGTGPFRYVEWSKNQRWVGEANPDYWDPSVVKLSQVTFRPITEEATRMAALRSGEVDLIDSLSGDQADELGAQDGIEIARIPSTDTIHLTFNFTRPPFNIREARWAVAHAIDVNTIVNDILKAGQAIAAPIPEGTVGYDAELVAAIPEFNPERSIQLLAEAGVAEGTRIEFKLNPAWFAKLDQVAEFVTEQLRAVGFEVELQFLEPGAYTEARQSHSFDLCVQQGNKGLNPDPNYTVLVVYGTFGLAYADERPDVVEMIEQARSELDDARRDELYRQIQREMYDDMAEFILYRQEYIWGVRDRVVGFTPRPDWQTRVFALDVQDA
jgi:peptide/nickel transport system substrate-binding protein